MFSFSFLPFFSPDAEGGAGGLATGAENAAPASADGGEVTDASIDAEFTDTDDTASADTATSAAEPSPAGKPGKDAEYARRRREYEEREAKRIERAVSDAREKAIIEALGGVNPYTSKPMSDSSDVSQYLQMKEIEKNGGDPLADYPEYTLKADKAARAAEAETRKKSEWYDSDRQAFETKYPDVSISSLISDPSFRSFSLGKVGSVPLTEMYESYLGMVSEIKKRSDARAAQAVANAQASPGALSGSSAPDSGFYTVEQVRNMSDAEVRKNYDKIRESMSKW